MAQTKRLVIIILFGIGAVIASFSVARQKQTISKGSMYKVILTADGYTPAEITIHKDDIIVFSTTEKHFFWPASDPHPIHTIYPAFDPKVPIDPKKIWQFTFDRVGTWQYHDHLAPYFTGTVVVTK